MLSGRDGDNFKNKIMETIDAFCLKYYFVKGEENKKDSMISISCEKRQKFFHLFIDSENPDGAFCVPEIFSNGMFGKMSTNLMEFSSEIYECSLLERLEKASMKPAKNYHPEVKTLEDLLLKDSIDPFSKIQWNNCSRQLQRVEFYYVEKNLQESLKKDGLCVGEKEVAKLLFPELVHYDGGCSVHYPEISSISYTYKTDKTYFELMECEEEEKMKSSLYEALLEYYILDIEFKDVAKNLINCKFYLLDSILID